MKIIRIPPEDPEAVRDRDDAHLDQLFPTRADDLAELAEQEDDDDGS